LWLIDHWSGPSHTTPTTPSSGSSPSAGASSSAPSSSSSSESRSSGSNAAAAPAGAAAPEFVPPPPPPPAHLVVTGRATEGDLTVGSTLTYTFTVRNTGGRAVAATLTDELPEAVAPIYADAEQGSCDGSGTVTCSLGSVGAGRSVDVTIVVQVMKPEVFANDADAAAGDDDASVDGSSTLRFTAGAGKAVRLALPRK
jgi:uncharacterized repeat protein (TIGR01451 family)